MARLAPTLYAFILLFAFRFHVSGVGHCDLSNSKPLPHVSLQPGSSTFELNGTEWVIVEPNCGYVECHFTSRIGQEDHGPKLSKRVHSAAPQPASSQSEEEWVPLTRGLNGEPDELVRRWLSEHENDPVYSLYRAVNTNTVAPSPDFFVLLQDLPLLGRMHVNWMTQDVSRYLEERVFYIFSPRIWYLSYQEDRSEQTYQFYGGIGMNPEEFSNLRDEASEHSWPRLEQRMARVSNVVNNPDINSYKGDARIEELRNVLYEGAIKNKLACVLGMSDAGVPGSFDVYDEHIWLEDENGGSRFNGDHPCVQRLNRTFDWSIMTRDEALALNDLVEHLHARLCRVARELVEIIVPPMRPTVRLAGLMSPLADSLGQWKFYTGKYALTTALNHPGTRFRAFDPRDFHRRRGGQPYGRLPLEPV